jgi:hypothetical protein
LHAHEITADDAALLRMMAGAIFGPDSTIGLPSGKTITGAEMARWLADEQSWEARPDPVCGHGGPMWKLDGKPWACQQPQGHDGDHSTEDGTWWPPEVAP